MNTKLTSLNFNSARWGIALLLGGLILSGCEEPTSTDRDFEREVEERTERILQEESVMMESPASGPVGLEEADDRRYALQEARAEQPSPSPVSRPAGGSGNPHDYSVFYQELTPHGVWFYTDHYGYIWQPQAAFATVHWKPYTHGHWVYTNVGWMWASDEPFGWAVYHYGRWVYLRGRGWCWVPGHEWAPSWVAWHYSDSYVGWAPLPPEVHFVGGRISIGLDLFVHIGPSYYSFVPTRHFGSRRLHRHMLAPERSLTIISETTNVTNFYVDQQIIINEGPDFEQIQQLSSDSIQTVEVRHDSDPDRVREGHRWSEGEVVVAAPEIAAATGERAAEPPEVLDRLESVERASGWEGVQDPETRQALQEQWAEESGGDAERFRVLEPEDTAAEAGVNVGLEAADRERRVEEEARRRVAERRRQQETEEATEETQERPRPEEPDRPAMPDRPDRPEQPERPERPEQPDRPDRPEQPERPELPDRPERPEPPERPDRPEQPDRPERPERPEQPERTD